MISKEINKPESGFYYDNQLNNPLLRVSLHPSTKPNDTPPKFSEKIPEGECLKDDKYYAETPICQAILSEDFNVSIANNLNQFGGDAAGKFWSDAISPLAPYADKISGDMAEILDKGSAALNSGIKKAANWAMGVFGADESTKKNVTSAVGKVLDPITSKAQQMAALDKSYKAKNEPGYIASIMGRSLVVTGTAFSYYAGTGFDFVNLSMKFTMFSNWDEKENRFVPVEDKIEALKFYVVGPWINVGDDTIQRDFTDFVKEFLFWQLPPGGFLTSIKGVDEKCYGTLKLIIGPFYSLENLIIRGATFNYSKTLCKDPGKGDTCTLHPLSCDVTLVFQPVTKFSGDFMFQFAHGGRTKQYREKIESDITKSLEGIKKITGNPSNINKM